MKKVITYGTYDLFHQGHYNILKRAKEYGDYLIVGVTSESFDIERGKIGVRDSLATRIENVRKTGFADEIIIEEFQGQKIQDVQKYGIDALVIGSDWYGKFDYLKPYCEVVYLERTKDISSTQLRLKQQFLQFGIILYLMVMLVQFLLGVETYIQMLENWWVQVLLHGIVWLNTFFLLSGEKYYNEDVGAE